METTEFDSEKRYLRQKDLAARYNVSPIYIYNLVKSGVLPPPMKFEGLKVWPIELIERIDSERNQKYIESLPEKWRT